MRFYYFCGFNGFSQNTFSQSCDDREKALSDWSLLEQCSVSYKSLVNTSLKLETNDKLELCGLLGSCKIKNLHISLPGDRKIESLNCVEAHGQNDLYIGSGSEIWKYEISSKNFSQIIDLESVISNLGYTDINNLEPVVKKSKIRQDKITKLNLFRNTQKGTNLIILINGFVVQITINNDKIKPEILYTPQTESVVDLQCGFEHCVLLTESGCVLTFGIGSRGQLGHGDLSSIATPAQIQTLEGVEVEKISAGGWHSCAITHTGDLYTWGWNNYGQLGVDMKHVTLSTVPNIIDVDPTCQVIDVACGSGHTIVLTDNGSMWSCGCNQYGQLGLSGQIGKCVDKFTDVNLEPNLKQEKKNIDCGPWSSVFYFDR